MEPLLWPATFVVLSFMFYRFALQWQENGQEHIHSMHELGFQQEYVATNLSGGRISSKLVWRQAPPVPTGVRLDGGELAALLSPGAEERKLREILNAIHEMAREPGLDPAGDMDRIAELSAPGYREGESPILAPRPATVSPFAQAALNAETGG